MTLLTNMQITLREGVQEKAIEAFRARRVFEECAQVIPGFLWARLLEVEGATDTLAVISEWRDITAYNDWLQHPVRAAQEADLVPFLAAPPVTVLYGAQDTYDRAS